MKNNFSEEDRALFEDAWRCWHCDSNSADSLHHIVGRGNKNGDVESSPLNAALLCNQKCHLKYHGYFMTDKGKKELLRKTFSFLIKSGYVLKKKDMSFIGKYNHLFLFLDNESIHC